MAGFKQSGSSKYHEYMVQLIHKIHEAEEMLLSGDDRHLEELKDIIEMIDQYMNESKGHKFEPMQYRPMQGRQQHGMQDRLGYRQYEDHYYPMYPIYPIFNDDIQDRRGRRGTRSEMNDYPETPEAYRRNQNRPNR